MDEKQRVLVVDDEQQITLVLRSGLTKHGYDVRVAAEGEAALELFRLWTPNLVVTDLSMPNMGGLELCRRLRAVSDVPIIVLSVKGEEATKIEALDAGADDYVTKPFGMGELLARVRATLRRSPARTDEAVPVIEEGDFRVDLEAHSVAVRAEEVHLSPKEFDILVHFIRHLPQLSFSEQKEMESLNPKGPSELEEEKEEENFLRGDESHETTHHH